MNVLEHIQKTKLVSISRKVYGDDLLRAVELVLKGGIKNLEITFDQSSKSNLVDTPQAIRAVKERFGDDICVGAGTVMTTAQAQAAKEAGANFALAPNTDIEVIKKIKQLGMVAVPGALTPSEVASAYEVGADIVKLFPCDAFPLTYLNALRAPISHVPLMAVGGVNVSNVKSFFEHGCMSAGIGSAIIDAKKIALGDFDGIESTCRAFVEAIAD